MKYYFEKHSECLPSNANVPSLIQVLYEKKTVLFKQMVNEGSLPPRSGIARLVQEARHAGVLLFVCSTSHKESVQALVRHNFGEEYVAFFTEFLCGDIVPRKKPAPDIYLLAKDKYKLDPSRCFVVEDSRNGLIAAKEAGMHCIITPSYYTLTEDFSEADTVVSCLGDPGAEKTALIRGKPPQSQKGFITIEDLDSLL